MRLFAPAGFVKTRVRKFRFRRKVRYRLGLGLLLLGAVLAVAVAQAAASSNGAISASFTTYYNGASHASSADAVSAVGPGSSGINTAFGTYNYASTVSSSNVFAPGSYTVYGGTCPGDGPPSAQSPASVTAGNTANVTVPLPAMIVNVYGNSSYNELDDAKLRVQLRQRLDSRHGFARPLRWN